MKIAIPINEKTITSEVSSSFGRAPYYLLYDDKGNNAVFIDNLVAQSAGGAGIKAAQLLLDNQIEVVIAPRCGENAAKVLAGGNVKVYKNIAGSAEDNIKAYKNNQLETLTEIHSGYHSHGK